MQEIGINPTKKSRKKNKSKPVEVTDIHLTEEITWVSSKQKELQEQIDHITAMLTLREAAEEAGCTVECQCCYGDFAFEEMCQCAEGTHLFCLSCLRRYAQEQLFGQNKTVLKCMADDDSGKQCPAGFDDFTMGRALSKKVMAKLQVTTNERSEARENDECSSLKRRSLRTPRRGHSALFALRVALKSSTARR